ncbi:ribonuclease Z [Alkalithermobacter paradoxus]|uniref:Ribonuclease Z n=1 Tax=Alkalithermobacter paradoxus TaxID=29349 RepID=A0A1V4I9J4_9FIRM|nr:ribonuclease Z [[Clostridium] thermoalcaliphilum]
MVDVCLLGCGGMLPLHDRYLTSLIISYKGRKLLIDCGEGTQMTLRASKSGFKTIDTICITHYHADHISGIVGVLLGIANSGRKEPLTIIGPVGLESVISGLIVIAPELPFDINLVELPENKSVITVGGYIVHSIQLDHSINCVGYKIEIKRDRKFDKYKAECLGVPKEIWNKLRKEENVNYKGKLYTSDMVLGEERKGINISYITDTRPFDDLIEFIEESDLFICEGMYGNDEDFEKAVDKKHMTFRESAYLAKSANVKELWLTHYSPALTDPENYIKNANEVFQNSVLGEDRLRKTLYFDR